MAKSWREFEKLVARIERAVSPVGAIVTSPDYVRDAVTGERREVDASIRLNREAPPIRVVECRDRTKTQDVMWIEQLIAKCRDHGIPTVAVSSVGFSGPATQKATYYGIETRRISDVTQEEMVGWLKIDKIVHVVFFPELATVNLELYCPPGETEGLLHPKVIEQIQAGNGDAPVFIRHTDGEGLRACQLLDAAIRRGLNVFKDVPTDGTKIRKQATLKFAKGLFWVQMVAGPRDLGKLILGVDVHGKESPAKEPYKGLCYDGTGRPAVYGIEAEGDVLGNTVLISLHKQVDSNAIAVTITSKATEESHTKSSRTRLRSNKRMQRSRRS
jgi:hypothetical protein